MFASAVFLNGNPIFAENVGLLQGNGMQFELNGKTFYFNSSNQYYLFYKSQNMVVEIFTDANGLGLNVFRTWGACDGVWKEGFYRSGGSYCK